MPLEGQDQSIVAIAGNAKRAGISRVYNDFVDLSTGIINKHFANAQKHSTPYAEATHALSPQDRNGAFKLVIDKDIHQGESWQLGVYLAHALNAQSRLSTGDVLAGDAVFITTGTVDPVTLSIGVITFLSQKAMLASHQVMQWQQMACDIKFLIPSENYRQPLPDISYEFMPVSHVRELSELLHFQGLAPFVAADGFEGVDDSGVSVMRQHAVYDETIDTSIIEHVRNNWSSSKTIFVLLFSVVLIASTLFYVLSPTDNEFTLVEYKIGLNVCSDAVKSEYKINSDISSTFPALSLRGLCGLQLSLPSNLQHSITNIWLLAESGALLPLELMPNGYWKIPLPSWQEAERQYSLMMFTSSMDDADFQSLSSFVLKDGAPINEASLKTSEMLANFEDTRHRFERAKYWITKHKVEAHYLHHRLIL